MPPLLDRDFSKTLDEIKKAVSRAEWSNKVSRSLGGAGFLLGVEQFYSNLAFDLQYQLAYRAALDQEVRTRAATKLRTRCLLQTMQPCPGKGRMKWDSENLSVADIFDEIHKRYADRLNEERFDNRIYPFNQRGQIRVWLRTYKEFIERIEKMVVEATFCQNERPDGKRIWFYGYKTDCIRKASKRFRDDPR